MILRKPYAFFIKYFKVLHFAMAILMALLIVQTNYFLTFFNSYINSNEIVIGRNLVSELFMHFTYLYIIFVLIMNCIVWIVLDLKNKKKLFYVINFLSFCLLLMLYIYIRSTLISMSEQVLDIRVLMVLRDLLIIAFVVQTTFTFVVVTRALGINLKKFDFENDLKDLNISSNDNEEFEINLELDTSKVRRNFRTVIRNLGYYFRENIRIILPICVAIIICVGYLIYNNLTGNITKIIENNYVTVPNYSLKITESYMTSLDYKNKKIKDDKTLIILKINIKTINRTEQFDFGKFALEIDDKKYYHTIEFSEPLKDVGNTYIKQKLTDKYTDYLLVYEVPNELINEKKNLVYISRKATSLFEQDQKIIVKLNPKNVDDISEEKGIALNEKIKIDNRFIKGVNLEIKNVEIGDKFKIGYKSCVTNDECYNVYEPLQASFYGNYDKALIKINMDWSSDTSYFDNPSEFIKLFAQLYYTIDNNVKIYDLQKQYLPKKVSANAYYYEIPKEVLSADSCQMKFAMREQTLNYIIK